MDLKEAPQFYRGAEFWDSPDSPYGHEVVGGRSGTAYMPDGAGGYIVYDIAPGGKVLRDNVERNGQGYQTIDAKGNTGTGTFSGFSDRWDTMNLLAPLALAAPAAIGFATGAGAAGAGAAGGAEVGALGAGGEALSAAELAAMEAAGAGLGPGAALGSEALAAYAGLPTVSLEAMAAAMGMTPEAFAALGAGGLGAAGAAAGMTAGTAAANGAGSSVWDAIRNGASKILPGNGGSGGFDWTSLIGPGLSAVGGIAGAVASKSAADSQLAALDKAAALSEPWRQAGSNALTRLQELLGIGGNAGASDYGSAARDFTLADFNKDPGYEFRQSEGEKGLQRAASAQGGVGSGKFLKDAMRFSQGLAAEEINRAFNRFHVNRSSKLNPLQSMAGQGQTAAGTLGEYATQGGNAKAAGTVGMANSLTNAIGQGWSMYQGQQQQNQTNALLNQLLRRG